MSFTLSLERLEEYRDEQASRINRLINDGVFIDTLDDLKGWDKLRDSLWGKGLQHLQVPPTDDARSVVEDPEEPPRPVIEVPEGIPPPLFPYGRRILERSEYEEAEQNILLANDGGHEAFMVSGNPGIGSPFFVRHPQNLLTLNQEKPYFWSGFLCDASFSGCPQYFKLSPSTRFSSTTVEPPYCRHSEGNLPIGHCISVKTPAKGFGLLLIQMTNSLRLLRYSAISGPSLSSKRYLPVLFVSSGPRKSPASTFI